jgi:hypothetical protein
LIFRNDNSKGKAKSAGAGIRRYNEQALSNEIQQLLKDWKDSIKSSSLVFVRATGANRNTIFFDDTILDPHDDRIRGFPFSTKRPTFAEIDRCFHELATVTISDAGEEVEPTHKLKKIPDAERPKTHLQIEPEIVKSNLTSEQEKIIDFIKNGRLAQLKHVLTPENVMDVLSDHDGISYIHLASSFGEADIVEYLLNRGADITLRGIKGNSRPYDMSLNKETRDVYRRFMATHPLKCDYKLSNIPGPLTPEMEEQQKERDRVKRKKEKEKKKKREDERPFEPVVVVEPIATTAKRLGAIGLTKSQKESLGMTPEQRMKLDREKRLFSFILELWRLNRGSEDKLINVQGVE